MRFGSGLRGAGRRAESVECGMPIWRMRSEGFGVLRLGALGGLTTDVIMPSFTTTLQCVLVPHYALFSLPAAAGPSMPMSPEGYRAELAAQVGSCGNPTLSV